MRKSLLAAGTLGVLALGGSAQAALIYDNTGDQQSGDIVSTNVLDDVHVAGGGPATIGKMRFGVENVDAQAEDVDAIITFWDTVTVSATGDTVVQSDLLGSFRRPLGLVAGNTLVTPAIFDIPTPITVTDGVLGVQIFIVQKNTTIAAVSVFPLMVVGDTPTIGSSDQNYWSDSDWGTPFTGFDKIGPGSGAAAAGPYLQLDVVPEPSTLSLIGLGGLMLLPRRRRNRR